MWSYYCLQVVSVILLSVIFVNLLDIHMICFCVHLVDQKSASHVVLNKFSISLLSLFTHPVPTE